MKPTGDQPMTDEYRQTFRGKIAQGLQSLREGKGTDGDAFMAQMFAELWLSLSSKGAYDDAG